MKRTWHVLLASLNLLLASGLALGSEVGDPVGPPSPPPQAAERPRVMPDKGGTQAHKAGKWRSKRKKKAAAVAKPVSAPAPAGPLNPMLTAAAVTMPPAVVAGLAAGGLRPPELAAQDLAQTAERIRKSWLLASAMGPPAMGVAVATLAAVEVGPHDVVAGPAPVPANDGIWDTHLPGASAAVPAAEPLYRRVRVFGHMAANHWEGERNVGARAGPKGTTGIWDASIGVESRLSEDMELRVRALSILPAVAADGDGAGAGSPGGAVNFKDYLYMRDIYLGVLHVGGVKQLNVRVGRVPLAFGDEYLQYDAPDNPLVSHSVPFFWGFDEGLQIYGNLSDEISYTVSALLDGEIGNGSDETASKAYGARIEGNHGKHWHWSASYFDNGTTGQATKLPALYFSRELAAPIGINGAAGGASKSLTISTDWWEGDARYTWPKGYVAAAVGGGRLRDDGIHDRRFEWFKLEPLFQVARKVDLVARFSTMGVTNPAQGYRFNNFETVGTELNFDVNERSRLSLGARYRANEAVAFKLERTIDSWKLIPTALLASRLADPNNRDYTVLQAAVSF